MKSLVLFSIMLMSSISFAIPGRDRIGNGGGLWACVAPTGTINSGMLVDLYEAREEFGLRTIAFPQTSAEQIVSERGRFLARNWLEVAKEWSASLADVQSKLRVVRAKLEVVDDSLFRMSPLDPCMGQWEYVQFANFTNLGQVLVREDLWTSNFIPATDKAALMWHEAIYSWLRVKHGDANSVRARQIVGLLFSDISVQEMKTRFAEIMKPSSGEEVPDDGGVVDVPPSYKWICMTENPHINQWYAGYGVNQTFAAGETIRKCQEGSSAFACETEVRKCEENLSREAIYGCRIANNHINKTYVGAGRSLLEAEFKAREACAKDPNGKAFFCDEDVTCN